ncbi:MAG: hypothetical protein FWB91_01985 [Defluviitaleaceae bacterium]|nr:hypothetical protein [Defluviitaleaceae bacterium]
MARRATRQRDEWFEYDGHLENGFNELAEVLDGIAEKVTDEEMHKRVLSHGAKPIVERAKTNARTVFGRSGRGGGELVESITDTYDTFRLPGQAIGWGRPLHTRPSATGFYGRMHEEGYRAKPGIRIMRGGRATWKNSKRNPQGRTVQTPHIRPALEAVTENAGQKIIEALQKELKE